METMGYRASRDEQGILRIHDVPIFVECQRGEHVFDAAWIEQAVEAAFQAAREGYHPPLHLRHHEAATEVKAAGYFCIKGTGRLTFKGAPRVAVLADLVVTDPTVQEHVLAQRLPYRSVEIFDVNEPRIDSLALLDHEAPYLELPMLMVSQVSGAAQSHADTVARIRNPIGDQQELVACFQRGRSAHVLLCDRSQARGVNFAEGDETSAQEAELNSTYVQVQSDKTTLVKVMRYRQQQEQVIKDVQQEVKDLGRTMMTPAQWDTVQQAQSEISELKPKEKTLRARVKAGEARQKELTAALGHGPTVDRNGKPLPDKSASSQQTTATDAEDSASGESSETKKDKDAKPKKDGPGVRHGEDGKFQPGNMQRGNNMADEETKKEKDDDSVNMADGEGATFDVGSIVSMIEDGSISVADMDALVAAVEARKAMAPGAEVEVEEIAAPAEVPDEAMAYDNPKMAMARLLGETKALRARLEEREQAETRDKEVRAALKRLEGRPLGADLEKQLHAFHRKWGAGAFEQHVATMERTFASYEADPRGAFFAAQTQPVPEVANRYLKDGVEAVERAAMFARQHEELARRGHVRMSVDRYVELNMSRN